MKPSATRIAVAAAGAGALAAAITLLYARRLGRRHQVPSGAIHIRRSITVNRRPEELYRFWRDLRNLPRIMRHLESVAPIGARRSHWIAHAPAGGHAEWDAEIVNDEPGRLIAWRSLASADVENAGSVRFLPALDGRGTEVVVEISYRPPAGAIGQGIAELFGADAAHQIGDDLRPFKQLMEAGEVATTAGQPTGRPEELRP